MRRLLVVLAVAFMVSPLDSQKWVMPRTPWGDPDLQGDWTSVDMLGVPLQRPTALGERSTLTDEEFANLPKRQRNTDDDISIGRPLPIGTTTGTSPYPRRLVEDRPAHEIGVSFLLDAPHLSQSYFSFVFSRKRL